MLVGLPPEHFFGGVARFGSQPFPGSARAENAKTVTPVWQGGVCQQPGLEDT